MTSQQDLIRALLMMHNQSPSPFPQHGMGQGDISGILAQHAHQTPVSPNMQQMQPAQAPLPPAMSAPMAPQLGARIR